MERVVVTNVFVNIIYMQVCAEDDVTDDEILEVCNRENPSGTTVGWADVVRDKERGEEAKPGPCADHPGRTHFLVGC